FLFQAEDGIRDRNVTGVQTCALPISLAERHGRDWRSWPAGYRRHDSPDVQTFVTENARRVRFHAWLQWLIDGQLAAAAREIAIEIGRASCREREELPGGAGAATQHET